MADVSQADFARAARGAPISNADPGIEQVVMGISSVARAAVRRAHQHSPAVATAYFSGKMTKWLFMGGPAAATAHAYGRSLAQYLAWDGGSGIADLDVGTRQASIVFAPGNSVRALAHVVRDVGGGRREARVLLWDELPLDAGSAEMIALPIIERVDGVFGAGSTVEVGVWQLAQPQRITVLPPAAHTRRADVEALLARF